MYIVDVTFTKSDYSIKEDTISLTSEIQLSQVSPVPLILSIKLIDVNTTGIL